MSTEELVGCRGLMNVVHRVWYARSTQDQKSRVEEHGTLERWDR